MVGPKLPIAGLVDALFSDDTGVNKSLTIAAVLGFNFSPPQAVAKNASEEEKIIDLLSIFASSKIDSKRKFNIDSLH